MSSDTFKRELSNPVYVPLNGRATERWRQAHTHTHNPHTYPTLHYYVKRILQRPRFNLLSESLTHAHTHTHIIYTVKCRHSDIHWPWLLRGPCLCVRVCALRKHHLPSSPLPLPFSFYWGSDLLSSLCQPWSCQRSVQWAKSEEKKEKRQAKKKKSGTWCSALSEISSSLLTFGFTHLIFLSDKVHKHASSRAAWQAAHMHTHSPHFGFLDEFKEGEGDMTSSLWSVELSLTLSVLVMSDESSQMGDFFFFFIWSVTDSGNGGELAAGCLCPT